ncbi:MAG: peptidoglycan DD-metalloendopeptidase family protein [Acidobacteriota bacterium]|jgi:murein DD-endopeptidase MepM/ murein hydrolase activator NlpD|nr:peptidoglycan DD-metalloendopeptidase family protein [Acidobacteriota bacterium]
MKILSVFFLFLLSLPANAENGQILAVVRDIPLRIPIENMEKAEFYEKSIGYIPEDVVRDGLPHFGAVRDDWKGKPRKHQGYDIYVNRKYVVAMAPGVVSGTGVGKRAGGWVKIQHERNMETLYIHLSEIRTVKGSRVKRGERIGYINKAVGNAISPQLHIEIRIDKKPVDPLTHFIAFEKGSMRDRLIRYSQRIPVNVEFRKKVLAQSREIKAEALCNYAVQLGAFSRYENAVHLKKRIDDDKIVIKKSLKVTRKEIYIVSFGCFAKLEDAKKAQKILEKKYRLSTLIIKQTR